MIPSKYEYVTVSITCRKCGLSQTYACLLPNKERGTLFASCSLAPTSTCQCELTHAEKTAREDIAVLAASEIGAYL